jgi:hypothetical protein
VARRPRFLLHPARFSWILILAFLASVMTVPAGATPQASRWKLVPGSGFGTYTGVAGLSTNDVWVVGYLYDQFSGRDLPKTLHWDGSRLTVVPAPAASPGYNHFNAVAMAGSSDVWAVGYKTPRYYTTAFTALIEHWDGSRWTVVPSPYQGAAELTAIAAVSPTDVWAVGIRTGIPQGSLVLHYDGTKWSTVADGHASDNTNLRGVAVTSANGVYVGGSTTGDNGDRVTFVERWNGTSWTVEPTLSEPEYNEFNAIAADPSGTVFGVGWMSPDLGYFAFTERYDGSTWTIEPTPEFGPPNSNLYGVVMTSPSQAWAVGYQSGHGVGPVIIKWDGAQWSVDPDPSTTCCILYGIGRAGNTLWAVGDNLIMRRGI